MEYKKITAEDIAGKGVVGQADTPLLSALEMQNKVEEVPRAVIIPHFNSLIDSLGERDADVDTALSDRYTKTETDNAIARTVTEIGAGDMAKAIYDTDGDGVVDNAAKLGGKTPGQLTFGADQIITDESTDERLPQTLEEKMDKSGGDFLSQSIGLSGGVVKIVGTDSFASFDINFTDTDGVKKFRRMFLESNGNAGIQLFTEDGTFVEHDNIITSKGGTFAKPIWVNNANPPSSSWNVKDISVTKSDGSSITDGITKVIAMRRK